jgi:5-methylcytosine-specific restriction endonuclease McrA
MMPRDGCPDWDVYVRDGCVCQYCGFTGTEYRAWQQLQIDHVIPQCCGGKDSYKNKAVACNGCNRDKGFFDPRSGEAFDEPPDDTTREKLIKRASDHIKNFRELMKYPIMHLAMIDEIDRRE